MKPKSPILSSLKEVLNLIKRYKLVITAIFLLEIIFFSALFFVNVKYQSRIYESVANVLEYLEKQELTEEAVGIGLLTQQSLFGEDPLMIYENYKTMVNSILLLVVFSFFIFVGINGMSWSLTHHMSKKKKLKSFLAYLGKFAVIAAAYSILILLFLYTIFKFSIMDKLSAGEITPASFLPLLLLIVIFYFAFVSFALAGKYSLKDTAKKTVVIGTKKAHIIIAAYLIDALVVAFFSFLLFLSVDLHIVILITAMLLFIASIVFSRMFLVLVVDKL